MTRTLAALVSVLALSGCAASPSGKPVASPSESKPSWLTASPGASSYSVDPADLKPEDFRLRVKILRSECFGSAGCSVSYRIVPQYTGAEDIESLDGTIEVTYKVTGGEDPMVNTLTIDGGRASVSEEEVLSTSSSTYRLKARATEVSVQ